MILNTLFDNIYVINLEKSVDRKNHIIKEFNRVGIEKYEFFNAVKNDSEQVTELINSNTVKKFPNCFRCNQKRCDCGNNYLTSYQIGNWCSFLNIFKDILDKKYNFVLICEDDVVFSHQHKQILNKLLSKQAFINYKMDMTKPLLIKMGTAYSNYNHNSIIAPRYIKSNSLCNPCFALNKEMAFFILSTLKHIDCPSDNYFFHKLPVLYPNIQYYTMFPYPIYELSYRSEKKTFSSTIRNKNSIERIEYKEFLFLTTNSLLEIEISNYFKSMKYRISNNSIDYYGNIQSYILLNEYDKKRFYFENKYLIKDNYIDEIKMIYNILLNEYTNNKISTYFNKYILKINEVLTISFQIDYNNLLKSAIYYYYYYLLLLEKYNIININVTYIIKIKNTLFSINLNKYLTIKNSILNKLDSSIDNEINNIILTENIVLN